MNIFELVVLSLAISADSFASSISIGIKERKLDHKKTIFIALMFSLFQSMMPTLGYGLANIFSGFLNFFDHWISFFVLLYLGISMIRSKDESDEFCCLSVGSIILISIAVTIDAFTVGITYSLLHVSLPITIILNFSITFITSLIGLKIGSILGPIFKQKAKLAGGLVLISIGLKILLSHLHILC